MPKNTYTTEFKADAVRLYEDTEGASFTSIGEDLGISRATLKNWVYAARKGRGVQPSRTACWDGRCCRMLSAAMSNKPPTSLFLVTLAGTVLAGCALMLMASVLFGALGEPAPWQGWMTGVLSLLFLAFEWGTCRSRRGSPKPHEAEE